MKLSQYMSRAVLTVAADTEFHRALDLMRSRRVHHLPVVDGGCVVGIITETDIFKIAAGMLRARPAVREAAATKSGATKPPRKRVGTPRRAKSRAARH